MANGNDTMFSLWNPTDNAQDFLLTIYYGDGSGKYLLPVHLDPQGSTMIGMAMLIREKMPDANGNIIPSRITEGSAAFENPELGKRMNLVISGGTLNVADATCHLVCINCCAVSLAILPFDPFCPVGQILDCSVQGTDCNGTVSGIFATGWSSSNTAIATVTSSGAMTGVAPGQITLTATFRPVDVNTGQVCLLFPACTTVGATNAPATVDPTITINLKFTGTKSAGDNLSFLNSSVECSESLGLTNCASSTGYWL